MEFGVSDTWLLVPVAPTDGFVDAFKQRRLAELVSGGDDDGRSSIVSCMCEACWIKHLVI